MRKIVEKWVEDKLYVEMAGASSESKPTANICAGSVFLEVNTGKVFFYDESNGWTEQFSFQS